MQQLQRDVAAGKVRKPRTIAERATRILVGAKATPYPALFTISQAGKPERQRSIATVRHRKECDAG